MMSMHSWIQRIEAIAVGIFGAFIGGDMLAATLAGGTADGSIEASSVGLALGGAVVMLGLLTIVRRTVGPQRPHKIRRKSRP